VLNVVNSIRDIRQAYVNILAKIIV